MTKLITNPSGAFGNLDVDGNMFQVVNDYSVVGAVAVAIGDAISLVWDETGRTLKAEPWDTDGSGQSALALAVGVSLDAGIAGDVIRCVMFGFARVNIGAGTATKYDLAIGSTTKGQVTSRAAGAAGTLLATYVGTFLGDEDAATNLAPVWVSPAVFNDTTA